MKVIFKNYYLNINFRNEFYINYEVKDGQCFKMEKEKDTEAQI